MKFEIIFTIFLIVTIKTHEPIKTFEQFKKVFHKRYSNINEENTRRKNFENALKYVEGNKRRGVKITQFADLSLEEFKSRYIMDAKTYANVKKRNFYSSGKCQIKDIHLPASIDLRKSGHVTPIQNQGLCGSCWAFSAIATAESAFLASNISVNLSVQELVDCASDHGCNGDDTITGFDYIMENGVVIENVYPYTGYKNNCNSHDTKRYKIFSYCLISSQDENKIKQTLAITKSAISVVITIGDIDEFRYYDGNTLIRYDKNYGSNYHAVNIVGYGTIQGVDYWIVRNSWGEYWGADGYAYLEMHKDLMGIDEYPLVAIV